MLERIEILKGLSECRGVSGEEGPVREKLLKWLGEQEEIRTDPLGNLLVFKRGAERPKQKVLFTAHMDETGFLITRIEENGDLKFTVSGELDTRLLCGKRVLVGENSLPGVIGLKPIHLLTQEERGQTPELKSLFIDIGACTREEAERVVSLGDSAVFASPFLEFGADGLKGKALGGRSGCAVLTELLRSSLPYDCWFAFTVQGESGSTGLKTAAYQIQPDICMVLEAAAATDIPGGGEKEGCSLGKGPVLAFADKGAFYDRELVQQSLSVARQEGIPVQIQQRVYGQNGARCAQIAGAGARILSLSIPGRYLASGNGVICKGDLQSTLSLAKAVLREAAGR